MKSVWTTNFDGLMLKTAHSCGLVSIEVTLESQDRIFRNDTDKELLCIAILDRILRHSKVVKIVDENYCLKERGDLLAKKH